MSDLRQVLMLRLGEQTTCALPVEAVQEIVPMALLSKPPGAPSFLEGFLNLRGRAVPVLRLNRILDLPLQEADLNTLIIVLKNRTDPWALMVHRVEQLLTVPSDTIVSEGQDYSFNNCVEGQIQSDSKMINLLSAERLFLEQEQRRVAELQAVAQQYLDQLQGD
jgi:purine-binding chemotaxis protein CheW